MVDYTIIENDSISDGTVIVTSTTESTSTITLNQNTTSFIAQELV